MPSNHLILCCPLLLLPSIFPSIRVFSNDLFGGHKQNFVCTRTQEKGAVTPQETDPDLPGSVQESTVEVWVDRDLLQGQGHWIQQSRETCWHKSFWRRSPLKPLPHHSLASGQTIEREHSITHQQKIGLKIYRAWPSPLQPVPPIRKLPQASYPYPSEGRQDENHDHRKLTKLITWVTALS